MLSVTTTSDLFNLAVPVGTFAFVSEEKTHYVKAILFGASVWRDEFWQAEEFETFDSWDEVEAMKGTVKVAV